VINVECDPSVLIALQKAFPKPKNSAKRQLDKYLRLIEVLIYMSMFKRSNYARIMKSYDIPLKSIWDLGPTINNKEYRVHEWLEKNGFALLTNIRDSSNITKEHALLKPTALFKVKNDDLLNKLRLMPSSDLDNFLDKLAANQIEIVDFYQKEFTNSSAHERKSKFHTTQVHIESLKSYIRNLVNEKYKLSRIQEETYLMQADAILRIAQVNNSLLHQKIDKKAFGRTYFEGHSVQSVSKSLREAILGDSWEYDCKSCSTSWKMAFAYEWHIQKKRRKYSVDESFSAMTFYLSDKQKFFNQVIDAIFTIDTDLSSQEKIATLKEAMTALGFGAKLSIGTWNNI